MDKKYSLIQDNSGSTLILVVVCITFISILCTLLLSLTVSNVQMKATNVKAKSNFYQTEKIFDRLTMGIEEEAAEAVRIAYDEVMKVYIEKNESYKNAKFTVVFLNELEKRLTDTPGKYKVSILEKYVTFDSSTIVLEIPAGFNDLEKSIADKILTLKNVRISYTDSNNYKTTISSDIVIRTPEMSFDITPNFPPTFSTFGLIADKQMLLTENTAGVIVKGDVYAGKGGITLEGGSDLLIGKAATIVTRGDISIKNKSNLQIVDNPKVWAKNITTLPGSGEDSAEITINGRCYIADDLALNAKNSKVTIQGEYYGYNYNASKTAESSSSIIINGFNSNLDLSNASKLLIAGRAYLKTEEPNKIQTGESLAIKGNQYAYLVPEEYIWCGTNPVTYEEYEKFISNPVPGVQEVLFHDKSAIKVSDYTNQWTKVFYNVGIAGAEKLVYYYLQFPSEEKANRYLQKYYEINTDVVDNSIYEYAENIQLKSPTNSIISSGNMFSFERDSVTPGTSNSSLLPNSVYMDLNIDGTKDTSLSLLEETAITLTKQYQAVSGSLSDMSAKVPYDKDSLFNSIIKKEAIASDCLTGVGFLGNVKTVLVDTDNVVYIIHNAGESVPYQIKENINLPHGGLQGMVIATGPVEVDQNYNGLILSGDKITIKSGVIVSASRSTVESILRAGNMEVNKYFRDYATMGASGKTKVTAEDELVISDLISFENWMKNED